MHRKGINKETISLIEKKICKYLDISPEALLSKSRKTELVETRKIIWYFCKEMYPHIGYGELGYYFLRDHSTALTGVQKLKEEIEGSKFFASYIETIRKELCFQSFSPFVKTMEEYRNLVNKLVCLVKEGKGISENPMYDGYIIGIMKCNPFSFEILNNKKITTVIPLANQMNDVIDWLNTNISKI